MSPVKTRFAVDPLNRLVLPQFRHILDGKFKIGKDNSLIYVVKAPIHPSCPQQLKLSGNWALDNEHNLTLTLNKENNQLAGEKITLQGEIIKADADKLEFLVSAKDSNGQTHLYILGLSGIWQADRHNRLKFMVQRKNDVQDELTFSGSWEVNKNNELIYSYTRTKLKTKEKSENSLTFKGYWDIASKRRIIYTLNKETGSGFVFSASFAEPLKQGLRYEVGIGVKPQKKKITLFGTWKLNKKIGLLFEMPAQEGKINALSFGANCKLNKNQQLEISLKNSFQENLGIKLRLSKSFLKGQGESFLEALKNGKEITFSAGIGFRW